MRTAVEIKVAFRSAKVAAPRTANGTEATRNDSAVLTGRWITLWLLLLLLLLLTESRT